MRGPGCPASIIFEYRHSGESAVEKSRRDFTAAVFGTTALTSANGAATSTPAAAAARFPRTESEQKEGVVPKNDRSPPGSFRRYGADPTGARDSTEAINEALQSNLVAFDDHPEPSHYKVTGALRFRKSGQIMRGQGSGDRGTNAATTIIYSGSAAGKVVSVCDGQSNWSQCSLRDVLIDGNGLANIGVEACDDAVSGGTWRVNLQNVAIVNVVNGRSPTAVYLGSKSAPNFANDTSLCGCFIWNCGRGLWGAGSWYQVERTTFAGCTECGVYAGTGSDTSSSAWTFSNCVFSANTRDFDGVHISQASFAGCWFENSKQGIYRAALAHSTSFTGCYLHTFDAAAMMDFGSAAGYHFFGGNFLPSDTESTKVINVNADAVGAAFGQLIPLYFRSGAQVPHVIPPVQPTGNGVRTSAAQLLKGQALDLVLGVGCFIVSVNIWKASDKKVRSQASYIAFLCDGDSEELQLIASRDGSNGGQPYAILGTGNRVTLTYQGYDAVSAYLSATGARVSSSTEP